MDKKQEKEVILERPFQFNIIVNDMKVILKHKPPIYDGDFSIGSSLDGSSRESVHSGTKSLYL